MSDDSPGGALPPRPREPGVRFAEDESEIDESPSPAPSPSNPRRPSESTVMNRDVVLSVDDRVAAVKNHGRPGKVYKCAELTRQTDGNLRPLYFLRTV